MVYYSFTYIKDCEVQLVFPKMWQIEKYWNSLAYSAPGGDLWISFKMSAYFLVFKAVFTFLKIGFILRHLTGWYNFLTVDIKYNILEMD